jgi:hypothetical protein
MPISTAHACSSKASSRPQPKMAEKQWERHARHKKEFAAWYKLAMEQHVAESIAEDLLAEAFETTLLPEPQTQEPSHAESSRQNRKVKNRKLRKPTAPSAEEDVAKAAEPVPNMGTDPVDTLDFLTACGTVFGNGTYWKWVTYTKWMGHVIAYADGRPVQVGDQIVTTTPQNDAQVRAGQRGVIHKLTGGLELLQSLAKTYPQKDLHVCLCTFVRLYDEDGSLPPQIWNATNVAFAAEGAYAAVPAKCENSKSEYGWRRTPGTYGFVAFANSSGAPERKKKTESAEQIKPWTNKPA